MATEKERALEAELEIEQRIAALNARRERWQQRNTAYSRRMLRNTQEQLDNDNKLLEVAKQRTKEADTIDKKTTASLKSFARLSGDVKQNLGSLNSQSNIYVNVQRQIIREEETRVGLSELEVEASEARAAYLRDISGDLLTQAKSTAKAEQDARGLNQFEQRREELLENNLGLTEEQLELAKDLLAQEELLFKKEQRLLSIKESQKTLMDQLPEGVGKAVDFAKQLGTTLKNAGAGAAGLLLLVSLVAVGMKAFTALEEAGEEFRKETGMTNTQMKGIKSDVNEIVGDFANLGVNAKMVYDTVAALKAQFGDIANFSKETTSALVVLNANFGVSSENAAKVQGIMEQVGGLSSQTAANVGLQVARMSNLAGVAPAKIFADIAENAETTSKFFKGDINLLAKQAVEARRLGTNLKAVADNAEKLLDFESGIEEELVAATFVGGQFNLSQARALAYQNDLVGAQKETLRQIQRSGDFRKKDYFTQTQLAKAAGMSVEEINKQLNAQERLSNLSSEERAKAEQAIADGLDITNLNDKQLKQKVEEAAKQKEIQSSLTNVKNTFDGLTASLGSTFLPIINGIASVFTFISDNMAGIVGFTGTLLTLFGLIYGIKLKTFILAKYTAFQEALAARKSVIGAISSIFSGQGKIPIVGQVIAAAMVGALFAAISKAASFAGDINSPAKGKTMVSTKEGGLFELSPNDDLVAAPGAAAALAGAGATIADVSLEGGKSPAPNLAALSAPLNAMINEIKALRADLNSGKIAVYMDTAKVTSNIGRNVDQNTRNSYNIASA